MTAAPAPTQPVTISPAQRAVLRELCRDGADNPVIANRLHLSPDTVKSHLKALLQAYGVTNRTALVIAAITSPPPTDTADNPPRQPATTTPLAIAGTAHLGPPAGAVLQATGCCHRLTRELPNRDRITRNPHTVTCTGRR